MRFLLSARIFEPATLCTPWSIYSLGVDRKGSEIPDLAASGALAKLRLEGSTIIFEIRRPVLLCLTVVSGVGNLESDVETYQGDE